MKILFLTPRLPYPPRKGDQAVAYHRLRTLGARHEITLLTFVEGDEDPGAEAALSAYCTRIVRIPHPVWRVAWNLLSKGLLSSTPLQVIYYSSPKFQTALADLMATERFDLIHAFLVRLRPYLEGIRVPVVMEGIDSMRLNLLRQVEVTRGARRWIYREELRRMAHYEPASDAHVARIIFVTPLDAKYSGSQKTMVIPLGVTIPGTTALLAESMVVFSGNMAYGPNVQAVTWFVEHCWPAIHDRYPHSRFRVLGGNPTPQVMALASSAGVEVVGEVSDMTQELLQATLAVAPMQSGSGMQFKILEAMACGLPVVASSLGRGSIAAEAGKNISIADSPAEIIKAVSSLLENLESRKSIGEQGKHFVTENHSWETAAQCVEFEWYRILSNK